MKGRCVRLNPTFRTTAFAKLISTSPPTAGLNRFTWSIWLKSSHGFRDLFRQFRFDHVNWLRDIIGREYCILRKERGGKSVLVSRGQPNGSGKKIEKDLKIPMTTEAVIIAKCFQKIWLSFYIQIVFIGLCSNILNNTVILFWMNWFALSLANEQT